MTYEQLLQARIAEALESLSDIEDCLDTPFPLTQEHASALVRERVSDIRSSLTGQDDHALTVGNKPAHLCELGDCRIVALAGSAWCWPHLTEGRNVCAVKGCSCPTRDRVLICTDHMQEYIAYASRTGKYEIQGWLITRLEVAHGSL